MCGDGRTARAAADAGHRLQPRAVMQVHPSSGRDGVLLTQLFPWRTGTPLASVDRDREHIAAHITYWGRHLVSHGSGVVAPPARDRKSTRLNSSHPSISYAVFCLKKKTSSLASFCNSRFLC